MDPFREGTPIFSRINRRLKPIPKGVVVNQILPSDDDLSFRAYLDIFADDSDEDMDQHIVITAVLSEDSKRKAQKLISAFLVHKLGLQELTGLCETLTTPSRVQ